MKIRLFMDENAMSAMKNFFMIWLVCISLFGGYNAALAEKESGQENPAEVKEKKYIVTLETILRDIDDIKAQIRDREKELKSALNKDEQERIGLEISKLGDNLNILRKNFDEIAAGIDLPIFDETPQDDFKWNKEVLDLLRPLIEELKSMTARPRQIEKLRNEMAYYENKLPAVKKAVENIRGHLSLAQDKNLKTELKELEKYWESREKQISNQLAVAKLQLEEISKEKRPFLESTQRTLKGFFKSRGRNLLLSLLAFLVLFLMLRLFHRAIYRFSPVHKTEDRPFYIRLCDVIYHFLTLAGAILAMLTVLYISGDWMLLSVVIVFIVGFAWAAKQNFPRFWEQIKILLNLGGVREKERVLYSGVPWRVASLNFYSQLENPLLKTIIRLPLRKIADLESRPWHKDESWFPCKEGDWVILADGIRGQVICQTHEMVELELRGGAHKTYLTENFLGLSPMNISRKFRLRVTFGIDYKHQAESTREIPEKLGEVLKNKFEEAGHKDDIIALRVDFKAAAASSLDFEIIADFSGRVAQFYGKFSRDIQKFAVEACNQYGWEIPFTQITVHNQQGQCGSNLKPESTD